MNARQWSKHLLTYGVGMVLLNALSFVLLPLYTRRIGPADFGVLELLNRSGDILQMFLTCGLLMAALSFYQLEAIDPKRQRLVFSTALRGLVIAGGLGIAVLQLFPQTLSRVVLGNPAYGWAVRIVLVSVLCEIVFNVGLLFQQAQLRSRVFVTMTVSRLLFGVAVNLVLVLGLQWGLKGILLANLIHTGTFAVIGAAWIVKEQGFGFDRALFVEMLKMGAGILPGGIFFFMLNNADRYVMQSTRGAAELGLYALGYKIGKLGVMFVMTPFMKVWGSVMVKSAKDEDGLRQIARVATYFTIAYMTFSVALGLAGQQILHVLTPQAYWRSAGIFAPVLLAHLFFGLATITDTAFYVTKSTAIKPLLMAVGGLSSMALYLLLIPRYGMMGGALATLFGFAALAAVSWAAAYRKLPVRYEFGRMAVVVGLAAALYALGMRVAPAGVAGLAVAVLFTLALPALLYVLPFATAEEKAFVQRMWLKAKLSLGEKPAAMKAAATGGSKP